MDDDSIEAHPRAALDVVVAVGKASEAFEYIERARGHLYAFHQLVGRADLLLGAAAGMLAEVGQHDEADRLATEIVGRNVLEGRWTFQVVDEFDESYYDEVPALRCGTWRRCTRGAAGTSTRPA